MQSWCMAMVLLLFSWTMSCPMLIAGTYLDPLYIEKLRKDCNILIFDTSATNIDVYYNPKS